MRPMRNTAECRGGQALSAAERDQLARYGYVVRERAFDASELTAIGQACEDMVKRLVDHPNPAPKIPAGSYCFQMNTELCTIVKWEPDHRDTVQGVEPFAHFDKVLRDWGNDPRFVEPICDLLGFDEIELFTEKLNLKRARVGGRIALHQDYPYWTENSQDAGQIATAILFLDDAHRGNGCLEVLPGSHLGGVRAGGGQRGFGKFEMDPDAIAPGELIAVEVPAGSVVMFGSLLVHRSTPNTSGADRRTLLYSYQPAGRPTSAEGLAGMIRR